MAQIDEIFAFCYKICVQLGHTCNKILPTCDMYFDFIVIKFQLIINQLNFLRGFNPLVTQPLEITSKSLPTQILHLLTYLPVKFYFLRIKAVVCYHSFLTNSKIYRCLTAAERIKDLIKLDDDVFVSLQTLRTSSQMG